MEAAREAGSAGENNQGGWAIQRSQGLHCWSPHATGCDEYCCNLSHHCNAVNMNCLVFFCPGISLQMQTIVILIFTVECLCSIWCQSITNKSKHTKLVYLTVLLSATCCGVILTSPNWLYAYSVTLSVLIRIIRMWKIIILLCLFYILLL